MLKLDAKDQGRGWYCVSIWRTESLQQKIFKMLFNKYTTKQVKSVYMDIYGTGRTVPYSPVER